MLGRPAAFRRLSRSCGFAVTVHPRSADPAVAGSTRKKPGEFPKRSIKGPIMLEDVNEKESLLFVRTAVGSSVLGLRRI